MNGFLHLLTWVLTAGASALRDLHVARVSEVPRPKPSSASLLQRSKASGEAAAAEVPLHRLELPGPQIESSDCPV